MRECYICVTILTRFQLSAELSAIVVDCGTGGGRVTSMWGFVVHVTTNFTCDTDALVASAGKALFAVRRRGVHLSVCDPALQRKLFHTLLLPGRSHTTLSWTQLPVSHEGLNEGAAI